MLALWFPSLIQINLSFSKVNARTCNCNVTMAALLTGSFDFKQIRCCRHCSVTRTRILQHHLTGLQIFR